MKISRYSLFLTALLSLGWGPSAGAVEVGDTLSDLDLPDSTVARKMGDLKGRFVYLDFWASWCGPCRQSFAWMNQLQGQYAREQLTVIAMNVDARRADADKFLARNPASFPMAFDARGDSAKKLGIKTMPTSMLISPEGKVLWVHQGFRTEDEPQLQASLAKALQTSRAR